MLSSRKSESSISGLNSTNKSETESENDFVEADGESLSDDIKVKSTSEILVIDDELINTIFLS